MDIFNNMLVLIIVGFVLMGIGFSARSREWGIWLLGLGILCLLGTIAYKSYVTFH